MDAIAATLPEKIASSGKIIVGVNIPYSPNEFKDPSGKIVGFDVDLVDAVGKVLGVTPEYTEADFDKIIPSIQAGSYDMGMSRSPTPRNASSRSTSPPTSAPECSGRSPPGSPSTPPRVRPPGGRADDHHRGPRRGARQERGVRGRR